MGSNLSTVELLGKNIYFQLYPVFAFYRGIRIFAEDCASPNGCTQTINEEFGTILAIVWIGGVLLILVGIYLDAVLPSTTGVRRGLCCCFDSCFRRDGGARARHAGLGGNDVELAPLTDVDLTSSASGTVVEDDVLAEEQRVRASAASADHAVLLMHLRKVFSSGKVAVDSVTLAMHHGECFGLLGPNGAGKVRCGLGLRADGRAGWGVRGR